MVKKAKWGYIICSVLFCLLGVLTVIFPTTSVLTLCYVFGVLLLFCGLTKIVGYFSHDLYNLAFQFDLALGIFVTAVGIILLLHPDRIISFFPIVIGLFILIDGVFKAQTSLDAKRFGLPNWWLILIGAILSILMSMLLILDPFNTAVLLMAFIGISLIIYGTENLFNAVYTVKIIKRASKCEPYYEKNNNHEV